MAERRPPTIAIVLYPGFTALDVVGPYEVFKYLEGAKIVFVANQSGPVANDRGALLIGATHRYEDVIQPDIIVVPGAEASTPNAMADRRLAAWLKDALAHGSLVVSVCSGALVLANAGLLRGQRATTHWAALPFLERFGVVAVDDERIVWQERTVTAAGVSAGIDLALAVVEQREGRKRAEEIQLLIEYDPSPTVDTGSMRKAPDEIANSARAEMARLSRGFPMIPGVVKLGWQRALRAARRRFARSPS